MTTLEQEVREHNQHEQAKEQIRRFLRPLRDGFQNLSLPVVFTFLLTYVYSQVIVGNDGYLSRFFAALPLIFPGVFFLTETSWMGTVFNEHFIRKVNFIKKWGTSEQAFVLLGGSFIAIIGWFWLLKLILWGSLILFALNRIPPFQAFMDEKPDYREEPDAPPIQEKDMVTPRQPSPEVPEDLSTEQEEEQGTEKETPLQEAVPAASQAEASSESPQAEPEEVQTPDPEPESASEPKATPEQEEGGPWILEEEEGKEASSPPPMSAAEDALQTSG